MDAREATYNERATWGECPVCHAPHGTWCDGTRGFALGRNVHGDLPQDGVHLERLQRAPFYIETVALSEAEFARRSS